MAALLVEWYSSTVVVERYSTSTVGVERYSSSTVAPGGLLLTPISSHLAKHSVLSLYLDERRGVQGNTSLRSREYFPVLPDSSQGTDSIQFIKVMKL